ncbi:MAG: amino acid permease [Acidobacteriaceae bacterium]|nr:amino acid permease [Acidobacteriaceae bacterium]
MTDTSNPDGLVRGLTLTHSISLVIGTILGAGIFLKTAVVVQQVHSPYTTLAAWASAGFLSLAGALTYAELGAMLPRAGGEYVFLRAAYGDLAAFLYGWMRVVIGGGGIAALAVGFSTFLYSAVPGNQIWLVHRFKLGTQVVHWQFGSMQVTAVALIAVLSILNCFRVRFGGRVQTVLTVTKVFTVILFIAAIFMFAKPPEQAAVYSAGRSGNTLAQFGAAMIAAVWTYNGWSYLPMVAGEVKKPGRNLPLALIVGMSAIMLTYVLLNMAYFRAVPLEEIATSNSTLYPNAPPVAIRAASTTLGSAGSKFVAVALMVSSIGALHGVMLSVTRIPFAMARDGLFFHVFGVLGRSSRVPVWSVAIHACWASLLAVSGTFDQLTDMAVFSYWIFYALAAAAIFVLRRKMPDAARPYKTLGYPVVPFLFVATSVWLLVSSLQSNMLESAVGLALMLLGVPLYLKFARSPRANNLAR